MAIENSKHEALVEKWRRATTGSSGGYKRSFEYGIRRLDDLDSSQVVLYACGIPLSQLPLLSELLACIDEGVSTGTPRVNVVIQTNLYEQMRAFERRHRSITFITELDQRVPGLLATSVYICVHGILPPYFIRRDGQRVLQLWDGVEERVREDPHLKVFLVTRLLNSTAIAVGSDGDVETVLDCYHMRHLYRGELFVPGEGSPLASCVARYLLLGDGGSFTSAYEGSSLSSVLILVNPMEKDCLKVVRRIIGVAGTSEFDFTVAIPGMINDSALWSEVVSLDRDVRVVMRQMSFSCTPDQYVDVQVALNELDAYSDFEAWYATFDHSVERLEAMRLFGDSRFDVALYVASAMPVWYLIIDGLDVASKKKVELSDCATKAKMGLSPNFFSLELETQANLHVFDAIAFLDNRTCEEADSYAIDVPWERFAIPEVAESVDSLIKFTYPVRLNSMTYGFAGALGPQGGRGSLVRTPEGLGKSYVVEASMGSDLIGTLNALVSHADGEDWEAFVVGSTSLSSDSPLLERFGDRVTLVGDPDYLDIDAMLGFIRHFDACVVCFPESRSSLRAAADITGTPILVPDNGRLLQVEACVFDSRAACHEVAREEVLRLLGHTLP